MKVLHLLLLIAAFGCVSLIAGELQFKVTPATLAGWEIVGLEAATPQNSPAVVLSAQGELARTFSGGAVILHSVSRPSFGQEEADWPILILGPAALVFKQEQNLGQLLLISGDGLPQHLPGSIPLDNVGRSLRPLDLVLAYDPLSGTGVVSFAEQSLSFQMPSSTPSVGVVISSGASAPWAQDLLEVRILADEIDQSSPAGASRDGTFVSSNAARKLASTIDKIRANDGAATYPPRLAPAAAAVNLGNAVPVPPASSLEIFTPPAVRNMQADALRKLVAKSLSK